MWDLQKNIIKAFTRNSKITNLLNFSLHQALPAHLHQRPLRAGVLQPPNGHSVLRCAVESTKIKSIISFTFFKIQSNNV